MISRFFSKVSACLFALLLLTVPLSVSAKDKASSGISPEQILLDGHTYAKDQIIWDFLNVAFSETLWLENSIQPWQAISAYKDRKGSSNEHWWQEYIKRADGIPKHDAINKFTSEITIGIGWPDVGYDFNTGFNPGKLFSEIVKSEVSLFAAEISAATKLPVHFIDSTDPREKTADFAKIRIVPIGSTGQENRFKVMNFDPKLISENYLYNLQQEFVGAVPFTASSNSQVDGYLLPKHDNSIGMAVCKVVATHEEKMIRSLIRECLVRSLGLIESSAVNQRSLLGNWNHFNNASSKFLKEDSERVVWQSPMGKEQKDRFKNFYEAPSMPDDFQEPKISDYERLMISLLYCTEIRAGMDKPEVIEWLKKSTRCFVQH